MITEELWIDLLAVRYVNQFGTPEQPMMEITCTPEKIDAVREFLIDNGIEIWPVSTNPFPEPSVEATDTTKAADEKRIGYFTRVLLKWCKAANFVQSKDTEFFYQRLIKQAVQSTEALHKWPVGISIDARGRGDSVTKKRTRT